MIQLCLFTCFNMFFKTVMKAMGISSTTWIAIIICCSFTLYILGVLSIAIPLKLHQRKRLHKTSKSTSLKAPANEMSVIPVYEDIGPKCINNKVFEVQENVAYGYHQ